VPRAAQRPADPSPEEEARVEGCGLRGADLFNGPLRLRRTLGALLLLARPVPPAAREAVAVLAGWLGAWSTPATPAWGGTLTWHELVAAAAVAAALLVLVLAALVPSPLPLLLLLLLLPPLLLLLLPAPAWLDLA
jgi:hypothetical protein